MQSLKVDGTHIHRSLLQVQYQPDVGEEAYDKGAKMLTDFFKRELAKFNVDELHPIGKQIIECCLDDGSLEDYVSLIPMRF